MKHYETDALRRRKGAGGGPRWRLSEFAEHYRIPVSAMSGYAKAADFPEPVGTTNPRKSPGGSATCNLYRLADLKAWWAKRQQKAPAA